MSPCNPLLKSDQSATDTGNFETYLTRKIHVHAGINNDGGRVAWRVIRRHTLIVRSTLKTEERFLELDVKPSVVQISEPIRYGL